MSGSLPVYDWVNPAFHRYLYYDGLDRLTSAGSQVFGGDHWHRFTYDALDNLKSWKLGGVKDYAEYIYDAKNQLVNIKNSSGATVVGIGYDVQGNVNNKNGANFGFDYGNRLRGSDTEWYAYDAHGRRILSCNATACDYQQYASDGKPYFHLDYRKGKRYNNIYLAGSVVAIREAGVNDESNPQLKYQHTDALGSPVAVTDAAGAVVDRTNWEPYGAAINKPAYDGIGYTGHVMDSATGLTYMQQRYYDPIIGRFLSVDPVGVSPRNGLNFNRYWYASNNPYKNTDPDGRCDGPSMCAIDRDIAAMNRGDMSRDEFMDRSEARAVGALAGLAAVVTGYTAAESAPAIPFVGKYLAQRAAKQEMQRQIRAQATRGIRSLEKRIAEHAKKLEDFRRNPTVRPGMEKMGEEAVRAQQAERIKHLETEIKIFKENIEKLRKIL